MPPIGPDKAKLYPPDWRGISNSIRERSGLRCECEGECGIPHGMEPLGTNWRPTSVRCAAIHMQRHPITQSIVILTVAHLWRGPCGEHNKAGEKCGDPSHLKAMCQRCHLAYDLPQHQASARATRRRRKASGDLFEEGRKT